LAGRPGVLVADRAGAVTAYALLSLQERGELFVEPGDLVYEGMVVGVNSRAEDLEVNPTREKHVTNHRKAYGEELVRLVPHRELSLEQSLEFIRGDECVEVTPAQIRLRKAILDTTTRRQTARREASRTT
jgi:GTP-binding protein